MVFDLIWVTALALFALIVLQTTVAGLGQSTQLSVGPADSLPDQAAAS